MIWALVVCNVALIGLIAYLLYMTSMERKRLIMAILSRNGTEMAVQLRAERAPVPVPQGPALDPNLSQAGI